MHNASSEPEYQTRATAWAVTWSLVTELWPGWGATEDQRRIWERLFAWRGQGLVRAAIERVFAEKTLSYPRSGYVLEILKGQTSMRDTSSRYELADEQIAELVTFDHDAVEDLQTLPEEYLRELLVPALTACFMLDQKMAQVGPAVSLLRHHAEKQAKTIEVDVQKWDPMLRGLVWAAWEKAAGRASVPLQGPLRQEEAQDTPLQETAPAASEELWRNG
ncbi:MAG: hypothetical protein V3S55_09760 [Nitrospiraceae bacterium]